MLRSASLPLVVVLLLGNATDVHAETARGTVYADRNGNGTRDRGEPPLAGVAVSNGHDVVETDARGAWTLTIDDGDVVFVVKPRDHRVPRDEFGLPRFHYVHRPRGTPAEYELRYPGLAPTGALPSSIDFGLIPAREPVDFDVLLLADPQPQGHTELDYVRDDVLASLVGTRAAFGITLGDIMYDDLSLLPRYVDLIGTIGVPWYHVAGNHELDFEAPDDQNSLETFRRHFGPTYYSFDVGKAHFVVLDNVIYAGATRGGEGAPAHGNGGYHGGFTERQLDWLERDLGRVPGDRLVVLAMHVPLRSWVDPAAPENNVLDRERFFAIVDRREHVIAFAGHSHTVEHHFFGPDDGWRGSDPLHQHVLATVSGAWWTGPLDERGIPTTVQRDGVPNGHSILRIEGNRARVDYRAANFAADHQMRIGFDRDSTEVYVNLFNGGPRSRVWMRVDDQSTWTELGRSLRKDPFVVEWMAHHRDLMKGWVQPVDTDHLWTGPMPSDLAAEPHVLHVRALDEYGTEHTGTRVFEIQR